MKISISKHIAWLLALVLLGPIMVNAQAGPDELLLRSGESIPGQFLEGDKGAIVFRTTDGLQTFRRDQVRAIFFDRAAAPAAGEFPAGFSAAAPHRLAHVIVMRRVTSNRVLEDGKFEPEIITVSGDGSTIAFYAPKSGLYLMNVDGSNRRLLIPADGTDRTRFDWGRFELSRNGKVFYWQGGAPIYRINTDGTGEQLLVRNGAEYEAFRLREDCKRIFFSQRGGIFSIDTEGRGDYKEIVTPRVLSRQWEVPEERCLLGRFDVSADGNRIAFVVGGYPKAPCAQLMAINGDGTGLRRMATTDFDPWALTMKPDGSQVVFWQYGVKAFAANWDGGGQSELPLPPWDANGSGFQHLNRFSADSQWFSYNGNESGGFGQLCRADGSGRYEPQNCGYWDNYENALFHGLYSPVYTDNLRQFVSISQYWRQFKPRQVVVGNINPRIAPGVPVLSEITFPRLISTNPQLPAHRGKLSVRIGRGDTDVERVQYTLVPMCMKQARDPNRWIANAGWAALQGDHLLHDDGKNGDATAGDGIYTTDNLAPDTGDARLPAGRYLLRIVAHDDQSAVIVDVDGIEVSEKGAAEGLPGDAAVVPGNGTTNTVPPGNSAGATPPVAGNNGGPADPPANPQPGNGIAGTTIPVPTDPVETVDAGVRRIEEAFRAGNIDAVMALVAPDKRKSYRTVFEAKRGELARVADLLATRALQDNLGSYAEFQVTSEGKKYIVTFERYGTTWCLRDL